MRARAKRPMFMAHDQAQDAFPPDGHARQMAASAVSVKVLQHAEQLVGAELVRRRLQRATGHAHVVVLGGVSSRLNFVM
jgi:hypothetical protein